MRKMITLPGIGGSGDTHWQTLWERAESGFMRFKPASWDHPHLDDWIQSLEHAVAACDGPPVLVAHSLACLLVAHWAARSSSPVAGTFLVSVPDPEGSAFPAEAASFRSVPTAPLRCPSLVIASTDDPYGELTQTRRRAHEWRSGLIVAGALGHINASSGLGDWPQGRGLLDAFCAGLARG
ncbi:alpha/beta hydrolase [Bradyrhizobium liaoningense]|uniref:RBBP9/YdeN family alpha/beta hydrolase n=1 Tax=Bradyrhizobium liaoningense TaxID=43992 RepID=UPI001BAB96C8|nr:alpha/beta hydrolase [Bradyrhizobium liaoningense]MBR0712616.1 serine hydrolase family protein [Bradyrhizobium liaoningense]